MIKPISTRQAARNYQWLITKNQKSYQLAEKYDYVICEYCGRPGWNNDFGCLVGHHIDHNRRNNKISNCYICHVICHREIHDRRIQVKPLDFQKIKNGGDEI